MNIFPMLIEVTGGGEDGYAGIVEDQEQLLYALENMFAEPSKEDIFNCPQLRDQILKFFTNDENDLFSQEVDECVYVKVRPRMFPILDHTFERIWSRNK